MPPAAEFDRQRLGWQYESLGWCGVIMRDRDAFPPTEDSITHLHRSGRSTGETTWHGSGGGIVCQVDGGPGLVDRAYEHSLQGRGTPDLAGVFALARFRPDRAGIPAGLGRDRGVGG